MSLIKKRRIHRILYRVSSIALKSHARKLRKLAWRASRLLCLQKFGSAKRVPLFKWFQAYCLNLIPAHARLQFRQDPVDRRGSIILRRQEI